MNITLGLEEEIQIIDGDGQLVAHDLTAGKLAYPDQNGTTSGEIHRCALEVQTGVCANADELIRDLANLRQLARRRAQHQGNDILVAGLHPVSSWKTQQLYDNPLTHPHYARLLTEYGDVARGAMSFGLHIHLGLSDAKWRMPVMNRLRHILPDVLALSASSPFFEGRDTGLQTWRHNLLDRYPRMGMPAVWPDDATYFDHMYRLRRLGVLSSDQGMWEDIRLHHRYGTIEVRICDATPSLDRNWLIATLLLCEAHTLVRELEQGTASQSLEKHLLDENRWRARRHGLAARWIDWHRDELVDTTTKWSRWLERLAPAATHLGTYARLEAALATALHVGTSADQQRAAACTVDTDLTPVVRHLVEETTLPWSFA